MEYRQDKMTRNISKIDLAVGAASFLVGIIQTYLGSGSKKPQTAEVPSLIKNVGNSKKFSSDRNITYSTNINVHHDSKSLNK